jgi:hypothetical protein
MSLEEDLTIVLNQLESGAVAERRQAVAKAANLLKDRRCAAHCRERIVGGLRAAAETDGALTVRDAARQVLSDIPKVAAQALLPDDSRHIVGVRCPTGHVFYVDKRRLCTETTAFVRQAVREDGADLDELFLTCPERGCGEVVKVRLDCGAYR